ncbi:Ig-like domain (group 2) [Eubacterium uniforme]|uniref:Ig-like domain (Group 2) n=1 Tax=Eubacterium uniforme TaxID=39495 RepID=A0A1T4VWN0_9FIRM|nr:Ig-like domain-containing protein [Eubacterium uniforme]SKA69413.1 Ig-like domain (group 2) [Eubacterium uniforme]
MKRKKNLGRVITTLAMALAITGVISMKAEAKSLNNIKLMAPSGKTVKVAKGKKVKLKTIVKKLKNKKVSFKSGNPKIAKVNVKGVVSGIKNGKTKITVKSKNNPKIKNTIKVVVYKNAVKNIKLNKKKINLSAGGQCKLKAKITPNKNVSKVLKYTSSNKNVAIVTKKGVIKAVAAGSAKITVKTTDGSNKKAVCKVTVTKKNIENSNKLIGIKNVKVRCKYALDVELTCAKKLDYDDFEVFKYYIEDGKITQRLYIESINTVDNIHYEIALANMEYNSYFKFDAYNFLDYNSMVKVKINGLSGVKEKVIRIDSDYAFNSCINDTMVDRYIMGEVGSEIDKSIAFGDDSKGYFIPLSYSAPLEISTYNVPEGLSVRVVNSLLNSEDRSYGADAPFVVIKGKCIKGLNGHKMVITGKDAIGRTLQINVYFYISDSSNDYGKAINKTCLTYKPHKDSFEHGLNGEVNYTPIVIVSGRVYSYSILSYNYLEASDYKATGLPENVIMTDDGEIIVEDYDKEVKAGVYNITISFTTKNNKKLEIPYRLTLTDGIIVKGKYTYADGSPCADSEIYFNKNYEYNNSSYANVGIYTNSNGEYMVRLKPGNYDIYESSFEHSYVSYQNVFEKDQICNLKNRFYRKDS